MSNQASPRPGSAPDMVDGTSLVDLPQTSTELTLLVQRHWDQIQLLIRPQAKKVLAEMLLDIIEFLSTEVTASVNYKLRFDQTEPDKVYLPTKKQMISLISEVRRVLRSAKKQASPSSYSEGNLQEATTLQSSDEVSSPTSETKIDPDTNTNDHLSTQVTSKSECSDTETIRDQLEQTQKEEPEEFLWLFQDWKNLANEVANLGLASEHYSTNGVFLERDGYVSHDLMRPHLERCIVRVSPDCHGIHKVAHLIHNDLVQTYTRDWFTILASDPMHHINISAIFIKNLEKNVLREPEDEDQDILNKLDIGGQESFSENSPNRVHQNQNRWTWTLNCTWPMQLPYKPRPKLVKSFDLVLLGKQNNEPIPLHAASLRFASPQSASEVAVNPELTASAPVCPEELKKRMREKTRACIDR
ncbi:hypothetical protein WMY93_025664 [Mugilogobius chulae]|uniref:Uncharacterized protein n=1 Tax=Mugilogobius chulae TaxID=88201 RepID=A0AAW0MZI0_9GOBI